MAKVGSRLIGGILLIVGTSIGAGMLALPISTSSSGFFDSVVFLFSSWLIMTLGALLMLEVNMYLPKGANMISMANLTLGPIGRYITWLCYLILPYALLAAYISGGADILQNILSQIHLNISDTSSSIIFTVSLGSFIYSGIKHVDYFNRLLMFIKLGTLLLLIMLITPHVSLSRLTEGELTYVPGAVMLLITSFGFASIVPSLRNYFDDDIKKLRKAIIIGSLIPLVCYIAWDAVLMGVIPIKEFSTIAHKTHTTTALTDNLSITTHSIWITDFFRLFAAICMFTAFLGVSLGLYDFLSDGLKLKKKGPQGTMLLAFTFLPPLAIVIIYPGAFLKALQFAGMICVIFLVLLPAIMAYRGRYSKLLSHPYQLKGGKPLLLVLAFIACLLVALAIYEL